MSKPKPIRVRDLTDLFGAPEPRPCLFCSVCHGTYSAHAGDYFMHGPETPLRCCKRPLVRSRVRSLFVTEKASAS